MQEILHFYTNDYRDKKDKRERKKRKENSQERL